MKVSIWQIKLGNVMDINLSNFEVYLINLKFDILLNIDE